MAKNQFYWNWFIKMLPKLDSRPILNQPGDQINFLKFFEEMKNQEPTFKLICHGKDFPCHKFIISIQSEIFKTMFYAEGGDNENKDKDTLEIHDLSPDILEIILGFMYKNSIDVKNINVDLLLVCDLGTCVQFTSKHMHR